MGRFLLSTQITIGGADFSQSEGYLYLNGTGLVAQVRGRWNLLEINGEPCLWFTPQVAV